MKHNNVLPKYINKTKILIGTTLNHSKVLKVVRGGGLWGNTGGIVGRVSGYPLNNRSKNNICWCLINLWAHTVREQTRQLKLTATLCRKVLLDISTDFLNFKDQFVYIVKIYNRPLKTNSFVTNLVKWFLCSILIKSVESTFYMCVINLAEFFSQVNLV